MFSIAAPSIVFTLFALLLALVILAVRYLLVPSVAVPVTVNDNETIQTKYAQTLLEGLSNNDIHLPSACAGAGTCGLCRVQLTNNPPPPNPIEQALLSYGDISDGVRLACQVNLRSAALVNIPEDILSTRSWTATVLSSRSLSPLIKEIRLAPEGEYFNFTPGYFMQVTAPPGEVMMRDIDVGEEHRAAWDSLEIDSIGVQSDSKQTRAYSLANRPTDQDCVTLMVRLALPPEGSSQTVPPGYVSSWLFTCAVGDQVELSGPHQGFHIQDETREMVFVGGGVGMAPLRSMIYQQIQRQHKLPMTFFYGARTQADLLYCEEFNEISDANNGFSWTPALSEPDVDWHGHTGFVHQVLMDEFLSTHQSLGSCDFYLCGPPLMIKATVNALVIAGVTTNHIFKDEFG